VRQVVEHKEQWNEEDSQQHRNTHPARTWPRAEGSYPTADAGTQVERKETSDMCEVLLTDEEISVHSLDIRVDSREHCESHKEYEEHIEALREAL